VRRRLTVAVLAVVVGTLVLTVAGSLLLVRRTAVSSTETDLTSQARALSELLQSRAAAATDRRVLTLLRDAGSYRTLAVVGLSPGGQFTSLPPVLSAGDLDVAALQGGQAVTGNVGLTVFVAEPVLLTARQRVVLGPVPAADTAVLVVTRSVKGPVDGLPYFLLVAGIVLVVGAVVAAVLARRISAPLARAVATTRRMAAGDLSARVPTSPHDDAEMHELAQAINALGDNLARARGMERSFLMSVSHDLRTPLTSIRGYAEALAEGAATDVAGAAGVIAAEAGRLDRLVQDLLDLARIDARRFSLDMRPVDVVSVASGVLQALRPEAAAFGVELHAQLPARSGPWVRADADRLAQVVANLLENGLKFTQTRVDLSVGVEDGWCWLTVTDDGPGIPPAALGRVFERHYSDDRTTPRRVGTGLGLAIVAELAHAMGGRLDARSPVVAGHGTRMTLRMPLGPDGADGPVGGEG
jgi:signal transduction histidine kinase